MASSVEATLEKICEIHDDIYNRIRKIG